MIRRRSFLALAAASCTSMVGATASAAMGAWRTGVHYTLLANPQPSSVASGKVEVREFFWYGCGHCYALDPALEEWNGRKAAFIEFVRTPVVWGGPSDRQHAKLYFTLQALKRPELHAKVFDAIHQQGLALYGPDEVKVRAQHAAFLGVFDITPAQFDAAYDSMMVAVNLQRAEKAAQDFQVANVPTLIVNGKYSTSVGQAGGETQLFALLDDLAASEKR
jgi:protein dithiol oxidoreductase (disulfide-forming)